MIYTHWQTWIRRLENTTKFHHIGSSTEMAGLGEVAIREDMARTQMDEVRTAGILARHGYNVVVQSGRQRTSAESQAVMRIVDGTKQPFDVLVRVDDTRQAKHWNRGVVGMDTKVNSARIADWHDSVKKITHILAQLLFRNTIVARQQMTEEFQRMFVVFTDVATYKTLGFHNDILHQPVFTFGCHRLAQGIRLIQHIAARETMECGPLLPCSGTLQNIDVEIGKLCVREVEIRRTIGIGVQKIGTCPVEDGHEVVAHTVDAFGGQIVQTLPIAVQLLFAVGATIFDCLGDGQALHHAPPQAMILYIHSQVMDFFACPHFAQGHIVKSRDNALHSYLSQHRQGDFIILAEPSPCKFHITKSIYLLITELVNTPNHRLIFSYLGTSDFITNQAMR